MFELLGFENTLRFGAFLIVLVLMALWEFLLPRRAGMNRSYRWPANFGIIAVNTVILLAIPVTAVGAALVSIQYKFGLFFAIEVPFWPKVILSLLVLDVVIYWQHRIFHMVRPLWRLHRMHHTDTGFDVSTALRFHPVEILLSILLKAVVIILLGAPVFAVVLFEIILNCSAMFNHSNVRMPLWLDRFIRLGVVTPDMHRVHHSNDPAEFNRNFGFCLSIWDKIFRSYTAQPRNGHKDMTLGLNIYNTRDEAGLVKLLSQPFRTPN